MIQVHVGMNFYPCMVVRSMEFKGQVDLELIPGIRVWVFIAIILQIQLPIRPITLH